MEDGLVGPHHFQWVLLDPLNKYLPIGNKLSPKAKRYFGTVMLDPTRVGRDASEIGDEVITHLVGLLGSSVRITMEIEAIIPDGAPEHVVRTVTENSREMKFQTHGFEVE